MIKKGGIFAINALLVALCLFLAKPIAAADATVSGQITYSATGAAVPGMYVYIENNSTGEIDWVYTDATGNYSITITDAGSGTAGNYTIYSDYNSDAYYAPTEHGNVYIQQHETFSLSDGETKTNNFSLIRQGKLIGYVYESNSTTPIASATVYPYSTNTTPTFSSSDITTAAGYYVTSPYSYSSVESSAAGLYNVRVTVIGYFGRLLEGIQLSNNTVTTQDINLTKASTITGTITNLAGTALANIPITLREISTGRTYIAYTDSSGNYNISVYDLTDYGGTAVGNYALTVSGATGYVGQSRVFNITSDESTSTNNNFSLITAGIITGTIYQSNGTTPIASTTVSANDGYGNTYTATSGTDGTYTLNTLRASSNYTVTVSKTDYVTQSAYNISVTAGATTANQNFNLVDAVTFSGTIKDKATGSGIEGTDVYLYNRAKPRSTMPDYSATTYTDGSFSVMGILPGNYRVRVVKSGYKTEQYKKVKIKADISGKNYELTAAVNVFGKVTNNNTGVANALVTIYAKKDSDVGYGSAYTDSKGYYYISNVVSGKYIIKVTSTQFAQKSISKKIKANSADINIKLGNAGTVSGFVYDAATGLPVGGYYVRVKNQAVTAYSDANGYYLLDGLAPGKYQLYITSYNYETSWNKNVKVKTNQETDNVNFTLTPKE
ncbi:MAG: carboxypeptidase regulatory-like domain-containing protein [Patescibacteria group bacterium]|jgi:hypothetical protein